LLFESRLFLAARLQVQKSSEGTVAMLRMALRDSESKQKEMRLAMEAQSVRVFDL